MGGLHSRNKGKRGEREVRDLFRERGFSARRGQQFSGSPDSPDVMVPDLPEYHLEVKFVENLNVIKAMEQARHDAGDLKTPLLFHRKSKTPWLITMDVETFFEFLISKHDEKQHCICKPTHSDIPKDPQGEVSADEDQL